MKLRHYSARNVTLLAVASLLALRQISCGTANPHAAAARAEEASMANSFSSNELLVQEVVRRMIAMLPPEGSLAVLLQLGQGPEAAQAKANLLASVKDEERIVWSQVTSQPGEPVADTSRPGAHVNTVKSQVEPAPHVVLLVNVNEGHLYMAARPPGPDALGPPTAGWTWVLRGP
ncbi:MAG: hypothetical protein KBG15_12435 [Kofleriaceae bacterium]|nr:hypothetical protein [Kofleriaceae bacterium]